MAVVRKEPAGKGPEPKAREPEMAAEKPEDAPQSAEEAPKAPETREEVTRDPWAEHCPKCGLLGCVAGHV
jgi:hypothetical protein